MTAILKVKGLRKTYDRFVLDGISFEIPEGSIVGFVGSNGAGKTTAIKSILGLVRPDGGSVEVFGNPVDPGWLPAAAKQRIGVVLDTMAFPDDCLVSDVALLGRGSFARWDDGLFSSLLDAFAIDRGKKAKSLSRGMGMKLQMAFALAHRPDLLILDEATAGLDPLARDEVLDMLRDFMNEEGRGILLSSHITTDLEKVADYVVCIDAGRPVFAKAIDEVCDRAGIVRCGSADAEKVLESGVFERGSLRMARGAYSTEILVPDRMEVRRAFPSIECDRANLEDYMRLMLKGEAR